MKDQFRKRVHTTETDDHRVEDYRVFVRGALLCCKSSALVEDLLSSALDHSFFALKIQSQPPGDNLYTNHMQSESQQFAFPTTSHPRSSEALRHPYFLSSLPSHRPESDRLQLTKYLYTPDMLYTTVTTED